MEKNPEQLTDYESVKNMTDEEYFNGNEFAINAFKKKYAITENETYVQAVWRVVNAVASVEKTKELQQYWAKRWFSEIFNDWWKPGGSIMSGAGIKNSAVSLANCNTLSLGNIDPDNEWDNLESIIRNLAYSVAKSAAYRQGLGVDFSRLRPRNSVIKNSAEISSGAVHWMDFIDKIGYYVGQCLDGDTPVLTPGGYKSIKNINVGDTVYSYNNERTEVTNIVTNKKVLYYIRTEYGDILKASKDHKIKILKNNNIIETTINNLNIGDYIISSYINITDNLKNQNIKIPKVDYPINSYNNSNRLAVTKLPKYFNYDLLYLIGFIYGNGHINKNTNIELSISTDWPQVKNKINNILFNLFGVNIGDYGFSIKQGDGKVEILSLNKYVTNFIIKIGFKKQKSTNLIFPKILKTFPLNLLIAFFDGLFDADGYNSKTKRNIQLALRSYDFLYELKQEFYKFGIIMSLSTKIKNKNMKVHTLSLVGLDSYELLYNNSKSIKIKQLYKPPKHDRLKTPYKAIHLNIKVHNLKIKDINTTDYISFKAYKKYKKMYSNFYIQKIVEIKKLTETVTYDITIKNKSHYFIIPGFIVSNSGRIPAFLFSMSIKHPDIEEFITVKKDYTRIQNANISVQVTNDFYKAVEADEMWELKFIIPAIKKGQKIYIDKYSATDQSLKDDKGYYYISTKDRDEEIIVKYVPARKLFRLIAENMWKNAEPGIQNIEIAKEYSNSDAVYDPKAKYDSRIMSTNALNFRATIS